MFNGASKIKWLWRELLNWLVKDFDVRGSR
jgi:hypothetical protein